MHWLGEAKRRQAIRILHQVAAHYGGSMPLAWLEEEPFDRVLVAYDEARWQNKEAAKAARER